MNGRFAYGAAGGANLWLGVIGLVFTALLVAASIVAIVMLINAARSRGVEVKGARLAGFWIVGLVLTPLVLALYVLCIKPEYELVPARAFDAPQHSSWGAPVRPFYGESRESGQVLSSPLAGEGEGASSPMASQPVDEPSVSQPVDDPAQAQSYAAGTLEPSQAATNPSV